MAIVHDRGTGGVATGPSRGPWLVGVDVGTTLTKVGVVDAGGARVADGSVPTPWTRVASGAEMRPQELLDRVRTCLAETLADLPPGPIAGLGVTGMAETVVLLDPAGRAIGPAVAWYDDRARSDYEALDRDLSLEAFTRRTGLIDGEALPTVVTLRFLLTRHEELQRASRLLSIAEFVVHGLGGDIAAEASLASRTGVFSVVEGTWWPDVIEWAGATASLFPEVRSAGSPWGWAGGGAGLERLAGVPLTVAGHDHLVAAVGCGGTEADVLVDSCGTAEALLRAVPTGKPVDPGAGRENGVCIGRHVLADHYCLLVGLRLGIDLMVVLDDLGISAPHGHCSLDGPALDIIEGVSPGGRDPDLPAGRWARLLEESVANATRHLAHIEALSGPVGRVIVSGGWADNPVLRALKARSFPPCVYPLAPEAGTLGAALFAGLAAGVYPSISAFPTPFTEASAPPENPEASAPPENPEASAPPENPEASAPPMKTPEKKEAVPS